MGCGGCRQNNSKVTAQLKPEQDQPLVYPDGTIHYAHEAPEIPGYKRDPNDPTKLKPAVDAPCGYRISGIMLDKDGTFTMNHVCNHSECPLRWKRVTLEDCADCDHREV
jgi:hypothetical protein